MVLSFVALAVLSAGQTQGPQLPPETVRIRRLKRTGASYEVLRREAFQARFGKEPTVPKTLAELRVLARRMLDRAAPPTPDDCGAADLDRLHAAMQNPDLGDADAEGLDGSFDDAKPTFPKTYNEGHFRFKYTDIDPNPLHNTTLAKVKAVAATLNATWDDFAANFKEPKHYVHDEKKWIDVEIYDIPGPPAGRTNSSWNHIELDKTLCLDHVVRIRTTPVHELFHRVQYMYGMTSPATQGTLWAAEGTAAWSQKYREPHLGDYMSRINTALATPDVALTSRSYDACALWVYLGERAKDEKGFVKGVFSRYSSNGKNMMTALNDTVKAKFGAAYTLEQLGNEWAFTNFIKDLNGKSALFDYEEDETATGWGYGPLNSVVTTKKSIAKGGATSTTAGGVTPYGADYYVFTLTGKPTKIDVTITALPGFCYNAVFYKGSTVEKYWRTLSGWNGNYSRTETIDPTKSDRVAVIVAGNPTGGAYTLKVKAR